MFSQRFDIASTLSLTLILALLPPCMAADEALSAAKMTALVKNAKIMDQSMPVEVVVDDRSVIVNTHRSPKATDNDCKIDAVFFAKTLVDAYPNRIKQVNVLFSRDADDRFSKVVVMPSTINDYGSRRISQQKLLDSLSLINVDPTENASDSAEQAPSVVAGPLRERRLMLLDRIQSLKQKGTGVKPFEERFQKVESLIQNSKTTEAKAAIEDLASKLKEQEQLRRGVENFHPVASSKASRNNGQASGLSTSQSAAFSGPADGGRAQQGLRGQPKHDPEQSKRRLEEINRKISQLPERDQQFARERLEAAKSKLNQNDLWAADWIYSDMEQRLNCPPTYKWAVP